MIRAIIRPALTSLLGQRARTGLTILGIGIGVASVISTGAIAAGASSRVEAQIDALGEDLLWIRAGSQRVAGVSTGWGTSRSLTPDDATVLAADIPEITACSPVVSGREQVIAGGENWNTRYQGVLPAFFEIRRRSVRAGQVFADFDVSMAARVLVLGSSVSTRLFGVDNPVGRTVRMGRFPFRVIGVLAPRGAGRAGIDRDDVVFVPLTTSFRNLDRRDSVGDIVCGVSDPGLMDHAEFQAAALLRWRHRLADNMPDDFSIEKPLETLGARAQTARTMGLLLTGVGAVSLTVGGVGIMNIMLVAVAARRREIGVRLAVGARVWQIRWQLLAEAAVLGTAGACGGIILGQLASAALAVGPGWHTMISIHLIAGATAAAVAAAVAFGYYPAHLASRLDPIDAIQSEA